MQLITILITQLLVMGIFMAVGFFLYKTTLVSKQGCKELGSLLLYIILPAAIINSYCVEKTPEKVSGLFFSISPALLFLLFSRFMGAVFFQKKKWKGFALRFPMRDLWEFPLFQRYWEMRRFSIYRPL